jgi:glycerophosphoryl diester phosphodiesterase
VPSRELEALGIPRLAEVLAWADRAGMALNLELKHDVPDRVALVRAVSRELTEAAAPILASSFDPALLGLLRVMGPRLPASLLTDPGQSYAWALQALARPPLLFGLNVERRQADPARIARWRRRGLVVGVWTVNDPAEARQLVADGVDLVITDQPGRILRALGA